MTAPVKVLAEGWWCKAFEEFYQCGHDKNTDSCVEASVVISRADYEAMVKAQCETERPPEGRV